MAGKWVGCKLADACSSIDYGLTASATDNAGGPRFLRITDIVSGHIDWNTVPYVAADDETVKKYRLDDGDIVLARTGASTGASSYVKNPPTAVFASYLVRLKAKEEFDSRFLAYYLKSKAFWSFIRGVLGDKSAQPNASASTMTQAPLCAPQSKDEQCAIAHILGALDDKIELNRRMNETLEAMAQALFKSWFVDLNSVCVKTEGWRAGKVKDIASLSKDAISPNEFSTETFDHYSIPAFDEGRLPKIEFGEKIQSNKFLIPSKAVLLSKLNPRIPRVWFVNVGQKRRSICSTEFLVTTPQNGVSREFIYGLFSSQLFLEIFTTLVTGTSGSHQRVKPEYLLAMDMVIPPKELIARFTETAQPLYKRVVQNIEESCTLDALRDTLLPKLISGELRVKDAERFLQGVSV